MKHAIGFVLTLAVVTFLLWCHAMLLAYDTYVWAISL